MEKGDTVSVAGSRTSKMSKASKAPSMAPS